MRKGDVVTDVAGEHVPDGIALIVAIRSHRPGDTVAFTVRRGGSEMRLRITLGSEVGVDAAQPSRGPRPCCRPR